jgi:hypothetical protein
MMMFRIGARALILFQFLFVSQAWACATCGLGQSFTPKIFFISLGFVALPLGFVGAIAWRLWRESRDDA